MQTKWELSCTVAANGLDNWLKIHLVDRNGSVIDITMPASSARYIMRHPEHLDMHLDAQAPSEGVLVIPFKLASMKLSPALTPPTAS